MSKKGFRSTQETTNFTIWRTSDYSYFMNKSLQ